MLCQECADADNVRHKKDREWYANMGFCYRCGKERVFGEEKICPECLAKASIVNKKYIEKKYGDFHAFYLADIAKIKAKGVCRSCRTVKAVEGHTYCAKCLAKQNERNKRRDRLLRLNRVGIGRNERPSYGLCYICGNPLDTDKRLCSSCCMKIGHNFGRNRSKNQAWEKDNKRVFGGVAHG